MWSTTRSAFFALYYRKIPVFACRYVVIYPIPNSRGYFGINSFFYDHWAFPFYYDVLFFL